MQALSLTNNGTSGHLTMSSLEISKLTGKEHKNVLRDIRNMFDVLEIDAAQFWAAQKYGNNNTVF